MQNFFGGLAAFLRAAQYNQHSPALGGSLGFLGKAARAAAKVRRNEKRLAKKQKKSWFKGLKAEFRKIIWVDNKTLGKQTVAVVAISAVTCGLITLVDSAVIEFVNLLIK